MGGFDFQESKVSVSLEFAEGCIELIDKVLEFFELITLFDDLFFSILSTLDWHLFHFDQTLDELGIEKA